jgi:hypothetical protein
MEGTMMTARTMVVVTDMDGGGEQWLTVMREKMFVVGQRERERGWVGLL